MRKSMAIAIVALLSFAAALPASAQIGDIFNKAKSKVDSAQARVKPFTDKANQLGDARKSWSTEDEEKIGEEAASKIIHVFGLNQNAALQKYINLVGDTVARQASRRDVDYHFAVLDTDSLNAMALPGGFVFVTRGALLNMKNEAELAGVLAHEVAHVDGRHRENEIKSQKTYAFFVKTGQEEGQKRSSDEYIRAAVKAFGDAVANAVLTAPFSASDESEADRKGLDFAAKSGYNPTGLRDFLQTLAAASDDPSYQQATGAWGQTHPPFPERVANLNKLMSNYASDGQTLEARYKQHVNDQAFAAGAGKAGQ